MESLVPAAEGPYPVNNAPPDQQPQDLQGALAIVDSIIWRDGLMDANEHAIFMGWVQQTVEKIQAFAQQAAMGGVDPNAMQGLGSSSAGGTSEFNPMGGGPNARDANLYGGM